MLLKLRLLDKKVINYLVNYLITYIIKIKIVMVVFNYNYAQLWA